MSRQSLLALVFFCLGIAPAPALHADERIIPPAIDKIRPVGLQRGTTTTFTVAGRNIANIKDVVFDVPGISAKMIQLVDVPEKLAKARAGVDLVAAVTKGKLQKATIEVTATKDVPPGLHAFRIRTPLGTSNLIRFDVGSLPEIRADSMSAGRGDAPSEAATLPATLVGTISAPGRVDSYQFDGRAGEQLVFRVTAAPLGSKLESLLVLSNESGEELAKSGEHDTGPDAVLTYKLAQAGKYTISVTDREKGGDQDHYYRVDAGRLPYVTEVFPLGVRAGEPSKVEVKGINLGEIHEITVNPPKSIDGWATMPVEVQSPSGWSLNTIKLQVGKNPEILEQEPNNTPAKAQVVSLPVTINGHISRSAKDGGTPDEDYFRFHARRGEKLYIEVAAARLGSPLDSEIEILDVEGKSIPRATIRCLGETVTTLNDRDSRTPAYRLTSTTGFHDRDYVMAGDELNQIAMIGDQPDEDVQLRSVDGLRWALLGTSPDAHAINTPVYRVEILPPDAEFPANGLPVYHLFWRNDDAGPGFGSDSRLNFTAQQDGDYILHLKDVRGLDGPDFAYRLSLGEPAPDYRLTAEPANPNIPKGGSTIITVKANRVRGYDGPIAINVEGLPDGVEANSTTIPAGQDSTIVVLTASTGASVDAPPSAITIMGRGNANGHDVERIANEEMPLNLVAVIPPADAMITASPGKIILAPGQDAKVTLQVERRSGFQGRVPCKIQNLPPGVGVVNSGLNGINVAENQTSATFTLHAKEWAQPITQPFYVVGAVESNSPTMHPSAPLLVEVVGNKEAASLGANKEGHSAPGGSSLVSPKP